MTDLIRTVMPWRVGWGFMGPTPWLQRPGSRCRMPFTPLIHPAQADDSMADEIIDILGPNVSMLTNRKRQVVLLKGPSKLNKRRTNRIAKRRSKRMGTSAAKGTRHSLSPKMMVPHPLAIEVHSVNSSELPAAVPYDKIPRTIGMYTKQKESSDAQVAK